MREVAYLRLPAVLRRPRGVGDINSLAAGIQTMEGYIPPNSRYPAGSLAWQNNNPGNIMFVGQPGAVLGAGGFAKWPSYEAGYQGLLNQIQMNASSGMTLSQFVCHYAGCDLACSKCPPGANDTTVYLNQLTRATGAGPDTPLSDIIAGSGSSSPSSIVSGYFSPDYFPDPSSDDESAGVLPVLVPLGILAALWALR